MSPRQEVPVQGTRPEAGSEGRAGGGTGAWRVPLCIVKLANEQATYTGQALSSGENPPTRGIKSEEEILLLFEMLEAKADIATWKRFLDNPLLSPLKLFKQGQKELFLRTLSVFARFGEWSSLYSLVKDCLNHRDGSGRQSLLASDWVVWKTFIDAASHEQETQIEYAVVVPFRNGRTNTETVRRRSLTSLRRSSRWERRHPSPDEHYFWREFRLALS
jgi:hypothetical protein